MVLRSIDKLTMISSYVESNGDTVLDPSTNLPATGAVTHGSAHIYIVQIHTLPPVWEVETATNVEPSFCA